MVQDSEEKLDAAQAAATDANICREDSFPTTGQFNWMVGIALGYFVLRLFYVATSISPFIPPDETTHFGISTIFAKHLLLPVNSPESFQFGLVTNIPWLYYWIMGKLLPLNLSGISDLVFLRLANIPLALAFVWYSLRTMRLLTGDRLTRLLFLVAITNTMMLSFLCATVSYDNLTNLLAAMAVYYLLAFLKERSVSLLGISLLCQLAGCLTKLTFLPLLVLNVLVLVHEAGRLPELLRGACQGLRRPAGVLLGVALAAAVALNVQLHIGNYLKYRTFIPGPTEVLPLKDAMKYRLAARGYIFNGFRTGKFSKEQALAMTTQIDHPGDRADAVAIIENYQRFKDDGARPMGLLSYIPVWTSRMAAGIYGIFGHMQMAATWPFIAPIAALALLCVAAVVVRWRPGDARWRATDLMAIAGFYSFYLMYNINYRGYLDSGAPFLALQGRYLFPVIGAIYAVASLYLMRLFRDSRARLGVWGVAVFILVLCDFPLFLARITPQWCYWPTN